MVRSQLRSKFIFAKFLSILLLSLFVSWNATAAGPAELCTPANIDAYFEKFNRDSIIDKTKFYAGIRKVYDVYDDAGLHYAGTDAIIDQWNADSRLSDLRWLAYILATAYHETAFKMYPVRETLAKTDGAAVRAMERSPYYQRLQRKYWRQNSETGEYYFGRGYVQLTHDFNYQKADKRFDIDPDQNRDESYYWNPENALDPEKAIRVTYDGMVYGWYVPSRCLLRHFEPNREADWIEARKIINGTDRADQIAEHATNFLVELRAAKSTAPELTPSSPPAPITEAPVETDIPETEETEVALVDVDADTDTQTDIEAEEEIDTTPEPPAVVEPGSDEDPGSMISDVEGKSDDDIIENEGPQIAPVTDETSDQESASFDDEADKNTRENNISVFGFISYIVEALWLGLVGLAVVAWAVIKYIGAAIWAFIKYILPWV